MEGVTVVATPEVTVVLPGVMTPVPPENVGVSVVEDPLVIVPAPAVRDVATGAGVENPPPVSPPPPPPPPHATKKAKTRPRLRGRRNLKNRIGAPINYINIVLFKFEQICSNLNKSLYIDYFAYLGSYHTWR